VFCYGSFLYNKNCFFGKIVDTSYKKAGELHHTNSAVYGQLIVLRGRDVLHALAAGVLEE
jgi:hypothetical protein